MAPKRPGFWLTRRVRRAGRKDARRTVPIQDFTRTHAIISTQNRVRRGQCAVNAWVIDEIEPIHSGMLALAAREEVLRGRMTVLSRAAVPGGSVNRALKRNRDELNAIELELIDIAKQRDANFAHAERILRTGRQALASSVAFYAQVAAEYERARLGRRGSVVAAQGAEIPRFESAQLEYYEDFAVVYEQMA